MVNEAAAGPLAGVRVLDLSRHLAGPHASMTLGDLGAEVIKVERPVVGDDARGWGPFVEGESAYFLSINRNKRSLILDLSDPGERSTVERLLKWADVLVENFRPGTLSRWGFDDDVLLALNPRLVHCAISAFGRDGPYRDRPGMDLLLQASGGLMSITGEPDRPPVRVGIPVVDLIASGYAVQGILAALHERRDSGLGQRVDIALQDGLMSWLSYHVTSYLMLGIEPVRHGVSHPSVAPYGAFATGDGLLVMAIGTDGLWRDLCVALGREELADDPRFASNRARCAKRDELQAILEEALADRDAETWYELLVEVGVPCSPIRSIPEVLADPGIRAREPVVEARRADGSSIPAPAIPVRLSRTPGSVRLPPPVLGEHSAAVLDELDRWPGDDPAGLASAGSRQHVDGLLQASTVASGSVDPPSLAPADAGADRR